MAAYVYMLRCKDDTLYTGWTNDIQHRLAMHRSGKGAKYTRGRGPLVLVYLEELADKSEALKREAALKKLTREAKLQLCTSWSCPPWLQASATQLADNARTLQATKS